MLNHSNATGTASPLTPMPPSPKGAQPHAANLIIITTVPTITQVSICESVTITWTREPLNDTNWNV